MTAAPARDPRCSCDADPGVRSCDHRTDCLVWREWNALQVRVTRAAMAHMEDRAAGRKRWKGAGAALTWYARTREAWASPKALTMRDEGSGRPSRGAESPSRRLFAAVVGAIKAAEIDDRERHPTTPAPLQRWVLEHFGPAGRSFAVMSEATERGGRVEWTEHEIETRVHRLCRVARDHLRDGGWLDDGGRSE